MWCCAIQCIQFTVNINANTSTNYFYFWKKSAEYNALWDVSINFYSVFVYCTVWLWFDVIIICSSISLITEITSVHQLSHSLQTNNFPRCSYKFVGRFSAWFRFLSLFCIWFRNVYHSMKKFVSRIAGHV